MNNGFITIHRKILEWEWYKDINTKVLFLHLLLLANHKKGRWEGIEIKRGQLITGRKELSKITGISQQSIRTSLTKLKSTNEITIKSTNKYSIITIVKYNDYQFDPENQPSNQPTNQPTTNQQPTTNNNNNINNILYTTDCRQTVDSPPAGTGILNKIKYKSKNTDCRQSVPKISAILVKTFLTEMKLIRPDGDYQLDNLFPAKTLAKQINEWLNVPNKEKIIYPDEIIIKNFIGMLNGLDNFHRKNATNIKYIVKNFNKITNQIL